MGWVTDMDRNNMGRCVLYRHSSSHQLLSQVVNISPVPGTEHATFFRSQNSYGSSRSTQNSWGKRSGEDEASTVATDNINKTLRCRNISSNVAVSFPQSARDDVNLMLNPISLSNTSTLAAIKTNSMNLVNKSKSAVLMSNITQLLKRTDGSTQRMNSLESHNLRDADINLGEHLF